MVRTVLFESINLGSSPYSPSIKKCSACKRDLDIKCFSLKNTEKNIPSSKCKECQRLYTNNYYIDNKNKYYLKNKRQRDKVRDYILTYTKEHPCVDCGEKDPIVLEFDHIKGKKLFNIGNSRHKLLALDRIQAEIDKCEVVCANCHKRRTAKTQNWAKAR